MTSSKKISFDDIHTRDKQDNLRYMMEVVNGEVSKIENNNEVLDCCPICYTASPAFFVRAFSFDMFRCDSCGLIFCNPYPNQAQLLHYYNSEMKSFENRFFRESFEKRVSLFLPRIEILQQYIKSGKLLDIGSAIGVFIEAAKRSDTYYDISCCDLSSEACDELRTKYRDIMVINDDVQNLDESCLFDIITLWDTIEHIVDLDKLIIKINTLLCDNGFFVFSTPNTNSFEWRIAGDKHVQLLPPGHVNLLNLKNSEILIQRHGLEVVDSFTLNASLDIGYVKKLVENGDADKERLGLFLEEELSKPIFIEMFGDYLVETKQAGNIVVVCKKKG